MNTRTRINRLSRHLRTQRPTVGTTSLIKRVQELLQEADPETGQILLDQAAQAYIRKLNKGSFMHAKELIDRQEGKVPQRLADADGTCLKRYVGMPIDDDPQAP